MRDAAIYLRKADDLVESLKEDGRMNLARQIPRLRTQYQSGQREFPPRFPKNHAMIRALEGAALLQTNPGPVLPGDSHSPLLRKLDVELAQPFLLDGALFGFLLVGRKESGSYSAEELEFLTGIADLVTMALHSAETQQTLERLNEDLRAKVERVSRQKQQILALQAPAPAPADPGEHPMNLEAIKGKSAATLSMVESIRKIAASSSTVLVRGESGTGKSLLAEVIHRNSSRSAGPFVTVHCATLSPGVLESELFGHVKGAYTGAIKDKIGRFQLANNGTLFLDEIGDISLDIQTKLLRVLQEMTFEPVGSNESVTVDVRVIAATHQPLEDLIRRGRWREDLFYRLNVISIRTPALRERREDIGELAIYFLSKYAQRSGKRVEGIEEEAFDRLIRHDWPGNIRELENVMERAVVMADSPLITVMDLPTELNEFSHSFTHVPERYMAPAMAGAAPVHANLAPLSSELDALERQRLLDALSAKGGNKSKAAELLGIPRSTFCSKLRKFGIA
ncbi:MAG: sigma 54-interacting transcriptional regulator [Planctomycetota bacterium]